MILCLLELRLFLLRLIMLLVFLAFLLKNIELGNVHKEGLLGSDRSGSQCMGIGFNPRGLETLKSNWQFEFVR